MKICAQCGDTWTTGDEPPSETSWCSVTCHDMWLAADPTRQHGWQPVAEVGIGHVAHLLNAARDRRPS